MRGRYIRSVLLYSGNRLDSQKIHRMQRNLSVIKCIHRKIKKISEMISAVSDKGAVFILQIFDVCKGTAFDRIVKI